MADYDCTLSPCTKDVCVIHGIPSGAELDLRRPHKVGGYNPMYPNRLCELPNCSIHTHKPTIFAVPINRFVMRTPVDEEEDVHDSLKARVYDPASNPYIAIIASLQTDPLDQEDQQNELMSTPKQSDFDPYLERSSQRQVFVSDGGSPTLVKDDDLISFDDRLSEQAEATEEDIQFPGVEEFSTPPEWYINKLTFGVRGRWDLYIPPNKDFVSNIFADEQEREGAIAAYGAEAKLRKNDYLPHVFMYGIRYAPEPGFGRTCPESRSIVISGLDRQTTIKHIMSKVKGGQIIRISAADFYSELMVFIQFAECKGAKSYAKYMEHNTVATFGDQGRVSLVNTHSYPISLEVEEQIQHGCTRLLAIRSIGRPQEFLQEFSNTCTNIERVIEDAWIDYRGILFVLFQSVTEAVKLFRNIHRESSGIADLLKIESSSVAFARDPCDQPANTLAWSSDLAREPYPSLLEDWLASSQPDAPAMHSPVKAAATEAAASGDDVKDLKQLSAPDYSLDTEKIEDPFTMGDDHSNKQQRAQMPDNSPTAGGDPSQADVSVNLNEDYGGLMPKYMVPQNDPAYTEILNRDHSDLVSKAEVMAIFNKQPFRTYSKGEIRDRYSAFFPIRAMRAAWKRGDMDYDPDVDYPKEEEAKKEEAKMLEAKMEEAKKKKEEAKGEEVKKEGQE